MLLTATHGNTLTERFYQNCTGTFRRDRCLPQTKPILLAARNITVEIALLGEPSPAEEIALDEANL